MFKSYYNPPPGNNKAIEITCELIITRGSGSEIVLVLANEFA